MDRIEALSILKKELEDCKSVAHDMSEKDPIHDYMRALAFAISELERNNLRVESKEEYIERYGTKKMQEGKKKVNE